MLSRCLPSEGMSKKAMLEMENISYHVAAGKIDKDLLLRIMIAIMGGTYDLDEELKLDIYNAIQ